MTKIFIGMDISGKTLDICLKINGAVRYLTIGNEPRAIRAFFKKHVAKGAVVVMENTGRYNWSLLAALEALDLSVYVLSPLHLKKSLGLSRGKNDKVDALRICGHIEKNQHESMAWRPSSVPYGKSRYCWPSGNQGRG